MNETIPRLLFTEEPYFDESFIGYILRLAELNEIPDMRWIFKIIRPVKFATFAYQYSFDYRIETRTLSKITGIDEENLRKLLYLHYSQGNQFLGKTLDVFGQQIRQDLIYRQKPKICPLCISEQSYCQKVWEIAFVTTCPVHKCLLLDYCSNCQKGLSWTRSKIYICKCQFDFRKSAIRYLEDKELQLSNYFHQIFNLPSSRIEFSFNYPIKTLSTSKLLKLLFFLIAYYHNWYDFRGEKIVRYLDNSLIHKFLVASISVFDNWENYYDFIESWSKQNNKRGYIDETSYSQRFELPFAYSKYELFNSILRTYFNHKEYIFLRHGFVKFLKKLPIEDSSESYLLDYLSN